MDTITAGAVIIGVVNTVQKQFPQVKGLFGVGAAVVVGIILGYFHFLGLDVQNGILIALGSSGVYKAAQVVGGK